MAVNRLWHFTHLRITRSARWILSHPLPAAPGLSILGCSRKAISTALTPCPLRSRDNRPLKLKSHEVPRIVVILTTRTVRLQDPFQAFSAYN